MIFPPVEIVRYAAGIMTLQPGDLILTGTPEGVGPLKTGEVVEVEIQGIGILRNPVKAWQPS
jgi:2-keto-4-pentenoate hydratase/2-oxohepta-3-ene-1,7-dioic acid hydratase in catechol pathway